MDETRLEIEELARRLRSLIWKGAEVKGILEEAGLQVIPARFYSPVPTIEELEHSFERRPGDPPYLDDRVFGAEEMLDFLGTLKPYAEEFSPPEEGNPEDPEGYFWRNPAFSFSDAMAYYCVVRLARPKRIVEIGSGFSTLVASQALEHNGSGEIVCIEPYPKPFLGKIPHVAEVVETPVQDLAVSYFADVLGDGDILFIDSTHTVKAGSDCLYIYLKLLPSLECDLLLHSHDIFLPEAYPVEWAREKHVYWTEQYLLMALLIDNPRFEVCFGSHYHVLRNPLQLASLMGGKWQSGGGSLWFRHRARRTPA